MASGEKNVDDEASIGHHMRFKSINEFNILGEIGKGGYSKVYLVQHKRSKRKYAIKAAFKTKNGKDRSDRTYMEIRILKQLKHNNIIKMKGWFEDDETIYVVLEYIDGKDCAKYYKEKLPNKMQVKTIMKQLISALTYIHSKGIVHRDIKLENILVDKNGNIKLIDFGLCAVKEEEFDMLQGLVGTVRYTAPELIKGEGYNESVDVWGVGIILFLLLTGEYPFDGSNKNNIFARIKEKNIHFSKYENLNKKEINLLKSLLEKNPDDRIELEEILNDPFFREGKK